MRAVQAEELSPGPVSLWDGSRHPLAIATAAVAAGTLLDRWQGHAQPPWLWAAAVALAGLLILLARRPRSPLATPLALLLYLALGGAWHHRCWRLFDSRDVGLWAREAGEPLGAEIEVLGAPRVLRAAEESWGPPLAETSQVAVRVWRVRDGLRWRPASGRSELRVRGKLLAIAPGDRLRVYGHLCAPRRTANPGDFDEATWRRMRGQLSRIVVGQPECVQLVKRSAAWHPRRLLAAVRAGARAQLARHMDPAYAALAAALLIGVRDDVAQTTMDAFFETGTIHLLAISGLHLSILLYAVVLALRLGWLSRHQAIGFSCLLVIPYTLVTEGQPPIVRAAVFVLVVSGGRLLSRRVLRWNVLGTAALCVLVMNPCHLFQAGVHLSFVAVCGLSYCAQWALFRTTDPLDLLIQRTRPRPVRWLRSALVNLLQLWLTSLVVWLLTLPLIATNFCLISPAAIALNPLLWPPTAAALFAGFALVLSGPLLPWAGPPLGWICQRSLQMAEGLVSWAASAAATHFWIPAPPAWWVAGIYLLLAAWAAVPRCRPGRGRAGGILAGWGTLGAALVFAPALLPSSGQLACTFFAVGHGTCVVVELPDRGVLLYDAGRLGPPDPVVRSVSRYLWSRRTYRLRGLVISHADADHFNAVPQLVERFRTQTVYAPGHLVLHDSPLVARLRAHLREHDVPLQQLAAGQRLAPSPGVTLEVLHPPSRGAAGSDNAQSIVLRLVYAGRSILLPGDLESPGLEQVLSVPVARCDVVMAPHHGSQRSHPAGFVQWARPKYVAISSGRAASPAVLGAFAARGRAAYETCHRGAIRVEIEADGRLRVRTWRLDPW